MKVKFSSGLNPLLSGILQSHFEAIQVFRDQLERGTALGLNLLQDAVQCQTLRDSQAVPENNQLLKGQEEFFLGLWSLLLQHGQWYGGQPFLGHLCHGSVVANEAFIHLGEEGNLNFLVVFLCQVLLIHVQVSAQELQKCVDISQKTFIWIALLEQVLVITVFGKNFSLSNSKSIHKFVSIVISLNKGNKLDKG